MKAPKLRAVEMVRRIRDRHARQLAGKTDAEIIAFYRAAGEAAMEDLRVRSRDLASVEPANTALEPTALGERMRRGSVVAVMPSHPCHELD